MIVDPLVRGKSLDDHQFGGSATLCSVAFYLRTRFYAKIQEELVAAGVDHVNTDQLDNLQKFLLEN
jgi:hypothetical protein